MKILIISYYYTPINRIASVRMSKVSYELAKAGHEVDVVCFEPDIHEEEDSHISELIPSHERLHVHRIAWDMQAGPEKRYYKLLGALQKRSVGKAAEEEAGADEPAEDAAYSGRSLKSNAAEALLYRLYKKKNAYMARCAGDELKALAETAAPELVIASYEPMAVLYAAEYCKKLWPKAVTVCDLRDVMTNHYYGKHVGLVEDRIYGSLLREERRTLDRFDAVTVVSHGQKQMILDRQPGFDADKISVIYNGFDVSEKAERQELTCGPKHIVFTGTLRGRKLEGFRWMLEEIGVLIKEGRLPQDLLRIDYAGLDGALVGSLAERLGLGDTVKVHGQLPRNEAIALQRGADMLLNLVWNDEFDKGILGGKFGEYMASEKPILGVVTGALPGSDLKLEIEKRGVGACFETVLGQEERERFKAFILRFVKGEERFFYAPGAVDDFKYDRIAGAFAALASRSKR